jgi:hypothetical protein
VVADEAICAGALQDRLRERFECLSRRVGASRKTRPDRTDEIRVGSWCALSQILPITPSLKPRRDKNCWSRRLKLCVSRRWQFPEFQYIAPVSLQMESRGRLLSCSSCVAFSNTALYADAVGLSPINLQASSQACATEVPRCCCRRRYNVHAISPASSRSSNTRARSRAEQGKCFEKKCRTAAQACQGGL